ncbi:hypothetical protein C8R43DRAFT_1139423 [Mycena crocata]|nr:hypothetical protein C8R43DRAFT_1139423 [Mycena crocata]
MLLCIHNTLPILLLFSCAKGKCFSGQTLYTPAFDAKLPFGASFPEPVTRTVSAAGVGTDGWTTYVEIGKLPSATVVIGTSTPTQFGYTATFEADASGVRRVIPQAPGVPGTASAVESCAFGGDGRAACVADLVQGGNTLALTLSGSAVPYYTLSPGGNGAGAGAGSGGGSAAGSTSANTDGAGSSKPSGAGLNIACGGVFLTSIMGLVVGSLLALV